MKIIHSSFIKRLQLICFNSVILLLVVTRSYAGIPLQWQNLAPGLEYTRLDYVGGLPFGNLYAFRFNLQQYYLELAFTQNNNKVMTIPDLVINNNAVIGVNGGFFSPGLKPLGLRINKGEIKNPIRATGWWGIFYIRNNQAFIAGRNDYKSDQNITFAVQSGPRLIIDGKIPPLKPGFANRTALGIDKAGRVILVVSDGLPLSTTELAQIMQRSALQGGLDCVDAINLDGGGSTQLYAQINKFTLYVPGFTSVSDAVLVMPKAMNDE